MTYPLDLWPADHRPLVATCIENPDSNEPRLVFADWLEERGELLGEFIRVQCKLANGRDSTRCPQCNLGRRFGWHEKDGDAYSEWHECSNDHKWNATRIKRLCEREAELLAAHGARWLRYYPEVVRRVMGELCENCHGEGSWPIRSDKEDLAFCTKCRGTGRIGGWDCGFPRVSCTCAEWCGGPCERCRHFPALGCPDCVAREKVSGKRSGRIPGIAAAVCAAAPARKVVLIDKRPRLFDLNNEGGEYRTWEWYGHVSDPWRDASPERQHYILPFELWKSLEGHIPAPEGWKAWDSEAAALSALSRAAVLYGRGLPILQNCS